VSQLLAGGLPGPGVVMEGVKEVKYDFYAAQNIQKRHKNGQFPALIDFKNGKTQCFT
jgi:hypothetical protein